MLPLLIAVRGLVRALAAVFRDPDTKALPVVAGALVLTGTIVGVLVALLTSVAQQYIAQKAESGSARERLRARRHRRSSTDDDEAPASG